MIPDSVDSRPSLFKKGQRSLAEELVGLSLFLSLSFALRYFLSWEHTHRRVDLTTFASIAWTFYHLFLPLAMWILWRRFSMRTHKLEFSLFFSQFFFETMWIISLFEVLQPFLSLLCLLLLLSNSLLSALIVWKKERISTYLMLAPIGWTLYIFAVTMNL